MKKALILAILSLIVISCAEDIIVNTETEVTGVYYGRYLVITNYDSGSPITKRQSVNWTFTDAKYDCTADTSDHIYPPFTCDFFGTYTIETNLNMDNVTSKRNMVCSELDFAYGDFTFRRSNNSDGLDSLIVTQIDVDEKIQKILRLKEIEIEEEE